MVVHRISGAFLLGTAAAVSVVLDRSAEHPKACVIDVSAVPVLGSRATIEDFVRKARRAGAVVYIAARAFPSGGCCCSAARTRLEGHGLMAAVAGARLADAAPLAPFEPPVIGRPCHA